MKALTWQGTRNVRVDDVPDPGPLRTDQGLRRTTGRCGFSTWGQVHVKRWIPRVLPLVNDEAGPLGVSDLATYRMPRQDAPARRRHCPAQAGRSHQGSVRAVGRSC